MVKLWEVAPVSCILATLMSVNGRDKIMFCCLVFCFFELVSIFPDSGYHFENLSDFLTDNMNC